jgi:hypothetical protein
LVFLRILLFFPSYVRGEIFNEPPRRQGSGGREERGNFGVVFEINRYLLGIIDLLPGDCYGKWI